MSTRQRSSIRGFIVLMLCCATMLMGAANLLLTARSALHSGAISLFRKGLPPLVLTAASSPFQFHVEAWGRLVLGVLLIVGCVVMLVRVAWLPPEVRASRLHQLSTMRKLGHGPNVPWHVCVLVILALLLALWLIAKRWGL